MRGKGIPKDSTTWLNTSVRVGSSPGGITTSAGSMVTPRRSASGRRWGAPARHGKPIEEVREVLALAVGGRPVAPVADGPYTIAAVVMVPPEYRKTPEGVGSITVPSVTGARIALSELADIRLEAGPVQVSPESAQRLVIVQANVRGRDLGGYVADVQRSIGAVIEGPSGIGAVWRPELAIPITQWGPESGLGRAFAVPCGPHWWQAS